MYKFHVRLLPSGFNNLFKKTLEIHSHQTRYPNKYHQIITTISQHEIMVLEYMVLSFGRCYRETLPTCQRRISLKVS